MSERTRARIGVATVAVLLVGVPFAFFLQQVITNGPLARADQDIAEWLNRFIDDRSWFVQVNKFVSFLGSAGFLFPITTALVITLAVKKHGRLALFLAVVTLTGPLVNAVLKETVDRPRPVLAHPVAHETQESFPSGHAQGSAICYGAYAFVATRFVRRRRRAIFAGAATVVVLIGVSRMMLGVHFLDDVLAGFSLGAAWLLLAIAVFDVGDYDTRGSGRSVSSS